MAYYALPKICRCAFNFFGITAHTVRIFQCCHCQPFPQFYCLLLYDASSKHAWSTLISKSIHTSNWAYNAGHNYFSLTCLTLFSLSNFSRLVTEATFRQTLFCVLKILTLPHYSQKINVPKRSDFSLKHGNLPRSGGPGSGVVYYPRNIQHNYKVDNKFSD